MAEETIDGLFAILDRNRVTLQRFGPNGFDGSTWTFVITITDPTYGNLGGFPTVSSQSASLTISGAATAVREKMDDGDGSAQGAGQG